ncbi:hypothetical protein D3C79_565740 [compost metagenome]
MHAGGDVYRNTGQYRVDHIQHWSHEHEGEFQRFGDPGKEGGKSARHHDTQHFGFVFRTRAVVDRQRRTRQTEHHDGEEARLVTAGDADNRFTGFDRLLAAEEVRDIVNAGHVEPEYRVQRMVQTDRDQQTVEECIDTCAGRAQLLNVFTEVNQATEDHRPDIHQDEGHQDHQEGDQDRHQTAAAEERQRFRQLNAAETVVDFGGDNAHQNTDELVLNLAKRGRHLVERDLLNHRHGGR